MIFFFIYFTFFYFFKETIIAFKILLNKRDKITFNTYLHVSIHLSPCIIFTKTFVQCLSRSLKSQIGSLNTFLIQPDISNL